MRHDEGVDGDEDEIVVVKELPELGDASRCEFSDESLGESHFDGESFVGKDAAFDFQHFGVEARPPVFERFAGKRV